MMAIAIDQKLRPRSPHPAGTAFDVTNLAAPRFRNMTSLAPTNPENRSHTTAAAALDVEALVARAQGGSLECFTEVLEHFEGRVFNFILRRIGGRRHFNDAEDLTQETFLRAWRSLGDFRPQHRFSTWLFTIAGRLVVDHLRHRRVRMKAAESLAGEAAADESHRAAANDPAQAIAHLDHPRGGLWNIAQQVLTAEQHAALWLRYAEDLSPGEVARVLGKNEVAVRVMLFRARQILAPFARTARNKEDKGVCVTSGGVA